MITNVKFASLWVADQDRAYDFYVNTLGFEVKSDITMPDGYRWLEVRPVDGETTITLAKVIPGSEEKPSQFPNIVFVADDIEATYKDLTAKGVEFVDLPARQPWGWWSSFKDPDGNVFGMGQRGE